MIFTVIFATFVEKVKEAQRNTQEHTGTHRNTQEHTSHEDNQKIVTENKILYFLVTLHKM